MARVDGALRRLKVTKLTPELSRSTGIDKTVAALLSHDNSDVRALSESITSGWTAQLADEEQRRAAKSKRGRKAIGTGAAGCKACQGQHRPHTCVHA